MTFSSKIGARRSSSGARRVAEKFEDFLFLARELAQLFVERALHFVFADFDAGLFADFGENEAEANATLSELAVFFARLFFGRVFVFEGLAGLGEIGVDLAPDAVEFGFDELLRGVELVHLVELVEDLTLDLLAGHRAVLAFDLAADDFLQAVGRFEAELGGQFVVDFDVAGQRRLP